MAFSDLFPPGVIVVERREPGDVAALLPEEAACIARAVPERAAEFAAGRWCAHRALEALGIPACPIVAGADRRPSWPAGVVGSIAHTDGLCVAVAGLAGRFASLGVDVEVVGRVTPLLAARICTDAESAWMASLPERCRDVAAALVFSAKESFYKCQAPLTGEWLGFDAVRIEAPELPHAVAGGGTPFRVVPLRPLALSAHAGLPLQGRYCVDGAFMQTGIAIVQ